MASVGLSWGCPNRPPQLHCTVWVPLLAHLAGSYLVTEGARNETDKYLLWRVPSFGQTICFKFIRKLRNVESWHHIRCVLFISPTFQFVRLFSHALMSSQLDPGALPLQWPVHHGQKGFPGATLGHKEDLLKRLFKYILCAVFRYFVLSICTSNKVNNTV